MKLKIDYYCKISNLKRPLVFVTFFIGTLFTLAQQQDYKKAIKIYSDKAWDAIIEKKDSGIYYSNKIIEVSIENDDSFNEMLGFEYRGIYKEAILNNYESAIQDFLAAIKIAEQKHQHYIADLFLEIGLLFQKIDQDAKGLPYLEGAVELSKKKNITNCFAILSLAETQSKLKKYQESEKNYLLFLTNCKLSDQETEEAYLGLAKNFSRQNKLKQAHENYLKAIKNDTLKGNVKYGLYYTDIVENAVKMNSKDTVRKYLKLLHKSFLSNFVLLERLKYFESTSNAYKILTDFKKVSEFQDSILKAKDSLSAKVFSKNLSELETQYQTKKKEEQLFIEKNKRKLWILVSVLSFVILLVVFILFVKNSKKRKQLQKNKIELELLLKQRNMLLKETHHRVKNSFQMVCSLLQLQSEGTKAKTAVMALDNAVQRVNSMIVLHQQLYSKENLLGIDIKIYVKDLIKEILNSYPSENIEIVQNIDSMVIDIDISTSIGLLINELATNSIKYAWQTSQKNKIITIAIFKENDHTIFKMFDNGGNIKDKNKPQNYGSKLIEILIERLNATQLQKSKDYSVNIKFKA